MNFFPIFEKIRYDISWESSADSHEICLICYFWKSGKIWNCHLLQIIGGALRVITRFVLFKDKFTHLCWGAPLRVTFGMYRVSSNKSRVSSNKKRVSSYKRRVSSYKKWVSSNKSRVSSYESLVSSNKRGVSSNKRWVSSYKSRDASNESRVSSNKRRVSSNKRRVSSYKRLWGVKRKVYCS